MDTALREGNGEGEREKAGNRSYLHEVGRVAGWEEPPQGKGSPLLGDRA